MANSPWVTMAGVSTAPAPSTSGTKRDFANMQNEKLTVKKPHKMGTHWELPKKLKLEF